MGSSVDVGQASGWALSFYGSAGEAGGSWRSAYPGRRFRAEGPAADPVRAAEEAARRARGKLRRYCAANRLNRLGTLTYAGAGCHDPLVLRGHVAGFFRALRAALGDRPFPYVWTAEWHAGGHGLHVHFAVGEFVPRGLIDRAWGRGFVHIKLLGDLSVGTGPLGEARKAAGYLSKYVGKAFAENRTAGLHRYEVAQGFQPWVVPLWGRTANDVIGQACDLLGGCQPEVVWSSGEVDGWQGPPAVWVSWAG